MNWAKRNRQFSCVFLFCSVSSAHIWIHANIRFNLHDRERIWQRATRETDEPIVKFNKHVPVRASLARSVSFSMKLYSLWIFTEDEKNTKLKEKRFCLVIIILLIYSFIIYSIFDFSRGFFLRSSAVFRFLWSRLNSCRCI